jgi:hypothetical protein
MVFIVATELTVKERAFAQLIIEVTKSEAYRRVYSVEGNARTQATNAYRIAKRPKVKQEVARLLRQRELPADDYTRIRDVALAGLMEIFLSEPDTRLRIKAGSMLLAYADAGLRLHPVPTEKERKYDELTQFLDQTLGKPRGVIRQEQEPPPVVELAQAETPLPKAEADNEQADPGNSEASESMAFDNPVTIEASFDTAPEPIGPSEEFDQVAIPGRFPAQFQRVPRRSETPKSTKNVRLGLREPEPN